MEQLPKSETIAMRNRLIGPSCKTFFKNNPLKIIRAEKQYMFDENNIPYLDCINNVAHVGHCHPAVVKAGSEQMAILSTNSRYLHDNIVLCADRIVKTLPDNLEVCFFVNSGSEANDLALRLAQTHTGKNDVITLEHIAYHGHLTSMIDISHYKFNRRGGVGQKDHVYLAPCPDVYRGKFRDDEYPIEELGTLYADEVRELCDKSTQNGEGVCAFIAESLLSCGGQVIPPKDYFPQVYEHVRAAGGVCIADEVQVGFGRVGKHWWAFETFGVKPDIVTMGKPMGNGHPVACVVTTRAIADSFLHTGIEYFNTYGGNPVSCAIANAVFETIVTENMMEQADVVGEYLLEACKTLAKKHAYIGDVRGLGLFVGIDLVKDRTTREAHRDCAHFVVQRMREEHILVSSDGPEDNVIKFKPPMVFTKENVDLVMSKVDKLLVEYRQKEKFDAKMRSLQNLVPSIIAEHSSKGQRPVRPSSKENIKSI